MFGCGRPILAATPAYEAGMLPLHRARGMPPCPHGFAGTRNT